MSDLLNEREVGKYLSISPVTLRQWRSRGIGPAFSRIGRLIRYRKEDVDQWVNANSSNSTATETSTEPSNGSK